jgi:hypothetical protein
MTPQQQRGIITYLRSLTPTPQSGKFDFGGLQRDGGMMGPPPTMGDDGGGGEDSSTTTPDATIVVDAGTGADATPE